MTGKARSLGLEMPLSHTEWEQKRVCSPKKIEDLLPEAGRIDARQEKQHMSPSAAEHFGKIKSYWEARQQTK